MELPNSVDLGDIAKKKRKKKETERQANTPSHPLWGGKWEIVWVFVAISISHAISVHEMLAYFFFFFNL